MIMKTARYTAITLIVCLASCLYAHETAEKTPAPGFRLNTEYAKAFVGSLGTCPMTVYPTTVRIKTFDDVIETSDTETRQTIINHLTANRIADPNSGMMELNLSPITGNAQYDFFNCSIKLMSEQMKKTYHVAEEVIIVQRPDNKLSVFGIHLYILDCNGNNAFSFLLNSHHQMFVDAKLLAEDNSKQAIQNLVTKSTEVALKALDSQIKNAKD